MDGVGSSPSTPGNITKAIEDALGNRIISAHAVKPSLDMQSGAHPRARGGNVKHTSEPLKYAGSSPPTRGNQFD